MKTSREAVEATIAALDLVRAAELEFDRANARLTEFARPVLDGLGIAFAKVGHPEHKHQGGEYWAMGSSDRIRDAKTRWGGGQGMSSQIAIYFAWVDEVPLLDRALGQPLYAAFWDKERAVRLLCEAVENYATAWEQNIGPMPQRHR